MTPAVPALAGALVVTGLIGMVAALRPVSPEEAMPRRRLVGFGPRRRGLTKLSPVTRSLAAVGVVSGLLIALATGVSASCDGRIGFRVIPLIRLGVPREQLMETLGICPYRGGGPSLMYAAEAVRAYDEFTSRTAKPA